MGRCLLDVEVPHSLTAYFFLVSRHIHDELQWRHNIGQRSSVEPDAFAVILEHPEHPDQRTDREPFIITVPSADYKQA
jgi:hypothetical protein